MIKFCPNCGTERRGNTNFCFHCGYDFSIASNHLNGSNSQNGGNYSNISSSNTNSDSINNYNDYNDYDDYNNHTEDKEDSYTVTKFFGYLFLICVPIFSIIIGIYLLTKDNDDLSKHGMQMIILGILIELVCVFVFLGVSYS